MFNNQLTLNDGRQLSYAVYGNPRGFPILFFHGTPGSRYECSFVDGQQLGEDTCMIVVDRPGYGLSDPKNNRTILNWTNDVKQLLDHLGLLKVDVVGVSGGGPYALACAVKLEEYVNHVAIVCGIGPLAISGDSGSVSDDEKRSSIEKELSAPEKMAEQIAQMHAHPEAMGEETTNNLSEFDRSVIMPDIVKKWIKNVKEATRSPEGMITDYKLLLQSWEVALNEISIPVYFWHGYQDDMVSLQHPRFLAEQIQGAELEFIEGAGHLGAAIVGTRNAVSLFKEKRESNDF
ncbi:alpha/beta hydrolase [Virgibacillus siamensis]|uniref:Alpha/beta hydrolase n=1 Tax=Virgibacillus siamensis TaxID=480071 RepID=A0ABP3QMQ5_9BACI